MEPLSFLKRLGTMTGLVLLQVLFLNRILLFGYVTPLFYLWFIVRFDSSMSRYSMLLWGFVTGLLIDVFTGTPGLNAASATLAAMLQPSMVKLFLAKERREVIVPGKSSMGAGPFAGYLFLMTLLHHSAYYILRSIPLEDWIIITAKIVLSTLLTFIAMLAVGFSAERSNQRRTVQ